MSAQTLAVPVATHACRRGKTIDNEGMGIAAGMEWMGSRLVNVEPFAWRSAASDAQVPIFFGRCAAGFINMIAFPMNVPLRLLRSTWLLGVVAGAVVLILATGARVRHIEYVSGLAGGGAVAPDIRESTGYERGVRVVVPPQRDVHSVQWILQTQAMVERGSWRLPEVNYDNAPSGRPVWTTAPYRWWLAAIGWIESRFSGRPWGAAIERAGLWADPALHAILGLAVLGLVACRAGPAGAAWASVAVVGLFPLGAAFLPGRPDEMGLVLLGAVLSVLPLSLGILGRSGVPVWPWFLAAGVAGGFGFAVSTTVQLPLVVGIACGGLVLALCRRRTGTASAETSVPSLAGAWRIWGIAGAVVCGGAALVEFGAGALPWAGPRIESNHLAYAIFWWGLAECMAVVDAAACRSSGVRPWRAWVSLVVALPAVAWLLIMIARSDGESFLAATEFLARVTDLPTDVATGSIGAWFASRGLTIEAIAAVLPIMVGLGAAGWVLVRTSGMRAAGATWVVLGPLVLALAGAGLRPGAWCIATALTLGFIAPVIVACRDVPRAGRVRWSAGCGALVAIALGLIAAAPTAQTGAGESVSEAEVHALMERDLAWWLARRAPEPEAIVLAPPELTVSLTYYGGVRGLGSPFRENEGGFRFAVRLAAASSPDEGEALVQSRGVRYIIMPSWDGFLDEYARLGANQADRTIIALLHRWLPPRWLRPIPFLVPQVAGVAERSVLVFEVVDMQDNPTALSRLAEFFLETGRFQQAAVLAGALREQFPTEPAAVLARAQIARAHKDAGELRENVRTLLRMIEDGSTEVLTWDRRVRLGLVLASARHTEEARIELQRSLDEMDASLLRTLTDGSLREFLDLLKAMNLEIADPELSRLATSLLRGGSSPQ